MTQDLQELAAEWAWLRYELRCEQYERQVCTARTRHGDWVPATEAERRALNFNAWHEATAAKLICDAIWVPRDVERKARKTAERIVGRVGNRRLIETLTQMGADLIERIRKVDPELAKGLEEHG